MLIKTKNDQTVDSQKTFLASTISAGGTSVFVRNIAGFYDNWNIQLGAVGEEKSEVLEIEGAPSGTTITTAGTAIFDHPSDTPVYSIKYNQIFFKRSTAGTSGTATAMTDGTVTITPDQDFTQFDDTSGSATYAYRVSLYSTGLDTSSSESDWITPAGHAFYSLGGIRKRVKTKLLSSVEDDEIDEWTNEWMETMNNTAIDVNEDYRVGTVNIGFSGTAQYADLGTATTDFKQVRRAWYTEGGGDWHRMTKQEYVDFTPTEGFSETNPYYHMRGDTEIGRNPYERSGTIAVSYYKLNAILDSDADNLPTPMKGYTKSFVNYALAQAYRKDKMIPEATALENQSQADLARFKKEMTPRNKSSQTYIDIVENIPGDQLDPF